MRRILLLLALLPSLAGAAVYTNDFSAATFADEVVVNNTATLSGTVNVGTISHTAGALTWSGEASVSNLYFHGGGTLTISGNGTLNLYGTFLYTNGTRSAGLTDLTINALGSSVLLSNGSTSVRLDLCGTLNTTNNTVNIDTASKGSAGSVAIWKQLKLTGGGTFLSSAFILYIGRNSSAGIISETHTPLTVGGAGNVNFFVGANLSVLHPTNGVSDIGYLARLSPILCPIFIGSGRTVSTLELLLTNSTVVVSNVLYIGSLSSGVQTGIVVNIKNSSISATVFDFFNASGKGFSLVSSNNVWRLFNGGGFSETYTASNSYSFYGDSITVGAVGATTVSRLDFGSKGSTLRMINCIVTNSNLRTGAATGTLSARADSDFAGTSIYVTNQAAFIFNIDTKGSTIPALKIEGGANNTLLSALSVTDLTLKGGMLTKGYAVNFGSVVNNSALTASNSTITVSNFVNSATFTHSGVTRMLAGGVFNSTNGATLSVVSGHVTLATNTVLSGTIYSEAPSASLNLSGGTLTVTGQSLFAGTISNGTIGASAPVTAERTQGVNGRINSIEQMGAE